jgi:hypothetical protein
MNQNSAAMTPTTTKTTKCCPMCRCPLGTPGELMATKDDEGQYFAFAICQSCAAKRSRWPANIRRQQTDAAIGLLSMNPQRYEVKLFDSKAAAWIYLEMEAMALGRERLSGQDR